MAKPTKSRFLESDLLEDAIGGTSPISGASLPSPGSGGVLRGLLPALFTVKPDNVNFNMLKAGQYDPASYYTALESSDTVVLPSSQAKADAIGYDPMRTFQAGLGNDTVTGGGLNDLVYGGHGNDRLYGNNGNDALMGGEGHDWLIGAKGNDVLWAGNGIDYIEAGDGNDIIIANEHDRVRLDVDEGSASPTGDKMYTDRILGGSGNDLIFATSNDQVFGGDGDDRIELTDLVDYPGFEYIVGENGNDVIIGSKHDDLIITGNLWAFWEDWTAESKAAHGGFADTVVGGAGNDEITTMMYCSATVDAGADNDAVYVLGLRDVITTGEGIDMVRLYGGACKADLGAGDDLFVMSRASFDNPAVSEITLGEGADSVIFDTRRWLTIEGNHQPLSEAPWILDFDIAVDKITEITIYNRDDLSSSLDPRYIYAVNIEGGSALVYDHPVRNGDDFCFARFAGVTALELQDNIDLNATLS